MTAPGGLSNSQVIGRLVRMAWRYRIYVAAMLVLQAVLMASAVLLVQLGGIAIDTIRHAAGDAEVAPPLPLGLRFPPATPAISRVLWIAAGMVVVAVMRAALNYLYTITSGTLVHHKIVVDLRTEVYAKLQRLSPQYFSDQPAGSIINRVTGDVQSARTFVDGVLLQLSVLAMSLVFYLTCMMRLHVGLTLACLATTPIVWWISLRFSRIVRPMFDQTRTLMDALVLRVAENVDGVAVVKSLGRQSTEITRFEQANDAVLDHQSAIFGRISRFGPQVQFLTQVNLFILLLYGGYLVTIDRLPLGTGLIVFAGLLQQFSNQVGNLSGLAGTIQQSLSGSRRVFEVLDATEDLGQHADPYRPATVSGVIDFRGVWFQYHDGQSVLRDVSLHVKAGERVAILGGIGQGKSTLLSLLPRFFDPQCGQVLLDGVDVRQWHLQTLRRCIGYVMQEPILVSNTIGANIAFGNPQASHEQVRMAARLAAAHEFIEATPEGYETVLGEYGMTLSGGQRQRIALARALLTDPSILLLDDPVSAVDPETEHEILGAMMQASRGRTTLIVANRLSTLRAADRIVVLDQGTIVQEGTHDELIRQSGHYRDVAASQGLLPETVS